MDGQGKRLPLCRSGAGRVPGLFHYPVVQWNGLDRISILATV